MRPPILLDGFRLIVQVETKHVLRLCRRLDEFGRDVAHASEVIDLPGNDDLVLQLFPGVLFQFLGDGHVLSAFDHLRIDDIGDDGLILARQVFIEGRNQSVGGQARSVSDGAVFILLSMTGLPNYVRKRGFSSGEGGGSQICIECFQGKRKRAVAIIAPRNGRVES